MSNWIALKKHEDDSPQRIVIDLVTHQLKVTKGSRGWLYDIKTKNKEKINQQTTCIPVTDINCCQLTTKRDVHYDWCDLQTLSIENECIVWKLPINPEGWTHFRTSFENIMIKKGL